jgi:hypothetical protein
MINNKALFSGLVIDENDNIVDTKTVGDEANYVINDDGFMRHVPAEKIDRAVLESMQQMIEGHEDILSEQAAKMMGQDDIFSKAMLENQLKNLGSFLDKALEMGIPEDTRSYLGMMGMRIRINYRGELLEVIQPNTTSPESFD